MLQSPLLCHWLDSCPSQLPDHLNAFSSIRIGGAARDYIFEPFPAFHYSVTFISPSVCIREHQQDIDTASYTMKLPILFVTLLLAGVGLADECDHKCIPGSDCPASKEGRSCCITGAATGGVVSIAPSELVLTYCTALTHALGQMHKRQMGESGKMCRDLCELLAHYATRVVGRPTPAHKY